MLGGCNGSRTWASGRRALVRAAMRSTEANACAGSSVPGYHAAHRAGDRPPRRLGRPPPPSSPPFAVRSLRQIRCPERYGLPERHFARGRRALKRRSAKGAQRIRIRTTNGLNGRQWGQRRHSTTKWDRTAWSASKDWKLHYLGNVSAHLSFRSLGCRQARSKR